MARVQSAVTPEHQQDVQPEGLLASKPKVPRLHLSQFRPSTLILQSHCPLTQPEIVFCCYNFLNLL